MTAKAVGWPFHFLSAKLRRDGRKKFYWQGHFEGFNNAHNF